MRKLILAVALSCVTAGFCGTASAARLDPAECRPLTQDNAQACCAAANWKHLVLSSEQELCHNLRPGKPLAAALPTNVPGTPPETNPPSNTNPLGTPEKGINNGFGNGDQNPPGNSGPNNNAENDVGGRANPSNSGIN